MITDQKLFEAFDKGINDGIESLSAEELDRYRIQEFIMDWENGILSGYFYNSLPDKEKIESTIAALHRSGLKEMSALLREAFEMFRHYEDPATPSTWEKELKKYDPEDRLIGFDSKIDALENYGVKL